MGKRKYYVVWKGRQTGVFDSWEVCKKMVQGFQGARYKSFDSKQVAEEALSQPYKVVVQKKALPKPVDINCVIPSIAIDAACSGNPGNLEYQGVDVATGQRLFHKGPYPQGTNNVGEFLALVHGLAYLKQRGSDWSIYSDSKIAMGWVERKRCGTKLKRTAQNEGLFELVERAERWLEANKYINKILKWNTKLWGEIPADFGRK